MNIPKYRLMIILLSSVSLFYLMSFYIIKSQTEKTLQENKKESPAVCFSQSLREENCTMDDIEAQREYPITWKEVSRNSGGEGFLSAFVILSSLLYYMRRDDTDIFADKNEGKVLIMDNPFAQTNASHLLIPLMDMAKKSNTQLICLTGLGGESIYNRFDNIYVLNLIAASLRGGTQYLKAEHKRGKEPDELVTARIEVGEQMELLF